MKLFFRWPIISIASVMLVALILIPTVTFFSGNKFSHAHASGAATITLSTDTAHPGDVIQVSGQGLVANEAVSLSLVVDATHSKALASPITDANGSITLIPVTIPDIPYGVYSVVATQSNATSNPSTYLSIKPVITLNKTIAYPGGKIGITGKGFASGDYTSFYLNNTNGYAFQYGGADFNGDFSGTVTLPNTSILQGQHTLIVVSAGSYNTTASAPLTIVPHVFPVFGKSGASSQLTGAGFTANETVQVYWGDTTGLLLGSSTTDASGNLSYTFTAPANLTQSVYSITVIRTNQKPLIVRTLFKIIPVTIQNTAGIHNGQVVRIKTTGFAPNETVNISWSANGGQLLISYTADFRGAYSGSFTPPSAPLGLYTLTAIGATSGLMATSTLAIGPGISVDMGADAPLQSTTVSGGGFSANETLDVYLQTLQSTAVTVTTDATGAFSVLYTLPATYNPTLKYHFYAVSANGNEHAATPFSFATPYLSTYDNANYGKTITLQGGGFAFGETVNIIWNYQQQGQFTIGTTTGIGFDFTAFVPSTPNQSSVTIAAIGTVSHIVKTVTVANDPTISLTPNTGTAGTVTTIAGGNFDSSTSLNIFLQGSNTHIATITTKPDGSFTATFQFPTITGAGNLVIEALDSVNNLSATANFAYQPVVTLTPTTIHYGDTIKVVGQHFAANEGVDYYFNGIPSGGVSSDANGAFTASIVANNNIYTGANKITFCGVMQSICADANFTVD